MFNKPWLQAIWPPAVAVLLLLAGWQLATVVFPIPAWMLPSPAAIVREFWLGFDSVSAHLLATVSLTLLGFAIGTGVGFFLSCILHLLPRVKAAFYPILILSQNIPTIVLAPLLMIWFGFGLFPKIVVITLVCFFPIAIATLQGLTQTDRMMMNYMNMIGASRQQIFWKLELPHAMPSFFSGLKIAATYSVMGAVIGEWLGTEKGLGMYMLLQKSAFRTDRVFVAIALIVLLSILLFGLIALLEKWLVRWKSSN